MYGILVLLEFAFLIVGFFSTASFLFWAVITIICTICDSEHEHIS